MADVHPSAAPPAANGGSYVETTKTSMVRWSVDGEMDYLVVRGEHSG